MFNDDDTASQSSFSTAVTLIGNKWKLLIVRNLLNGKAKFEDLRAGIEQIGPKTLTECLDSMLIDGIIVKSGNDSIAEYELSDFGNSLKPTIDSMRIWGEKYKEMKS
jgi:DNA-binding HxlR family transcriptional regulator